MPKSSYTEYKKYSDEECWRLLTLYLKELEKYEQIKPKDELAQYQLTTSKFNLKHRILKLQQRLRLISSGRKYVIQFKELEQELKKNIETFPVNIDECDSRDT